MEIVKWKPFEDTDGSVVGFLHTPIEEMEVHRKKYPAVVLCPGGGYSMVSQREADPVALRFFARGYNVFTLTYSVGEEKAKGLLPLRELSQTVIKIRESREEYGVDAERVAVCGFSAGGHLACSLGTLWNAPELLKVYDNKGGKNRPDAMILCYPVITADEYAHVGSIENVSGCKRGTPGYEYFSLDKHVSEKTPPAFIWHTVPDDCVPVENSLKLASAMSKAGVSFEAHLFPRGGHGMSVCTEESGSRSDYNAKWMELCLDWLDMEFEFHL